MLPKISLANLKMASVNGRPVATATVVKDGQAIGERYIIELILEEQRGLLEIVNHKQVLHQLVIGLGFAA